MKPLLRFIAGGVVGTVAGILAFLVFGGMTGAPWNNSATEVFGAFLSTAYLIGPPTFLVGGIHMVSLRSIRLRTPAGFLMKSSAFGMIMGLLNFALVIAWMFVCPFRVFSPDLDGISPSSLQDFGGDFLRWMLVASTQCGAVCGLANGLVFLTAEVSLWPEDQKRRDMKSDLHHVVGLLVKGGFCSAIVESLAQVMSMSLSSGGGFGQPSEGLWKGGSAGWLMWILGSTPVYFVTGAFHMLFVGVLDRPGRSTTVLLIWSLLSGLLITNYASGFHMIFFSIVLVPGLLLGVANWLLYVTIRKKVQPSSVDSFD